MLKTIVAGAVMAFGLASAATAQICPGYSYPLNNGAPAYGSEVISNFNTIANCVNTLTAPLANPHFSGYVGIGTGAPAYPLDVVGNARVSGGLFTQAIQFNPDGIYLYDAGSNSLGLRTGPSSSYEYFTFRNDGFLIANSNGVYANGPIEGTAFYSISDGRLKKNIAPLSGALSIIQGLRPVRYQWRGAKERAFGLKLNLTEGESHLGFIAQEVAAIVPEAVSIPQDADTPYQLKPMELIAVLVQAVKEQQVEIDQLKTQLASKP